ncbi:MAG: hypothetical protein E7G23_01000 [Streptococcus mitis]|jgi:hypothetical protein|uniref:DUF4435 domain-containing protein n=3 Tax=Streptococcus TaxID=1301 RepID=A0A501PDL5_9STRE|nr:MULTISPECIES: hypothetical protein [Streptococcus]MBV7364634.1 hypothetical protein [Streptococcus vulneris]MDU3712563.1 hypothetical protein [Streptococcus mitis]RSJ91504.1 hypothetical protein D8789_00785 [Streptococcus mitis]TPD58530.1 hypothetical protein FJN11_03000 [Streptococcus symci]
MNTFDINKADYFDGVEKLIGQDKLIIYAEDPEFYSCYITPKTTVFPEGMSCDQVRQRVIHNGNMNAVGIVDGDFNDSIEHDNLFKINYYSIENIALYHHRSMSELKNKIVDFLTSNLQNKLRLDISFNHEDFHIKHGKKISREFNEYVDRKIKDAESYILFMDLKEVVLRYGKNKCKKCFKQSLSSYVPQFESLFSSDESIRILEKLLAYKAIDLPSQPNLIF